MGNPRHPHTRSSVNQRRMHIFIKHPVFAVCPRCKKPIKQHTACPHCGYYKNKEVIDVLNKLNKKEKKAKEKEIKAAEKEQKSERPLKVEKLSKK